MIISTIFIIFIGFIIYNQVSYTVNSNNIEKQITAFINKKDIQNQKISIQRECSIDSRKFVLFTINEQLEYAELKKGLNSKYKIINITSGFNLFRYDVIKTNKSKYLIMLGKNVDMQIDHIKAKVANEVYKISIPKENYFISYCKIPSWASLIQDPSELHIIDKADKEITGRFT